MTTPAYPAVSANTVVLWGRWYEHLTRAGRDATIRVLPRLAPNQVGGKGLPNQIDRVDQAEIKLAPWETLPLDSGLWAFPLVANDDAQLGAFGGWEITAGDEPPFIVELLENTPLIPATQEMVDALTVACERTGAAPHTIAVNDPIQAVWVRDAAVLLTPAVVPPPGVLTSTQVVDLIAGVRQLPLGGTPGQMPTPKAGGGYEWTTPAASGGQAFSGSAGDITSGVLADARIPATITRDSELADAVTAVIAQLRGAAPEALNDFLEVATRLQQDQDALSTLTNQVASKLAKAQNLADLPDKAAARAALELAPVAKTGTYDDLTERPQRVHGRTGGRVLSAQRSSIGVSGSGDQIDTNCPAYAETTIPFPRSIQACGLDLTAANAVTIPEGADGWYDATVGLRLSGGSAGNRDAYLKVNGTARLRGGGYGVAFNGQIVGSVYLVGGDVVTVGVYPAQTCIVSGRIGEPYDTYISLVRRGVIPVRPVAVGHTGGAAISGVTPEAINTWTTRDTWAQVQNIDPLTATDVAMWVANNPTGLLNVATALIPHGQAQSTWNGLLDEVIAGTHDAKFTTQGQRLAQYGTTDVVIRPWWEMNMDVGQLDAAKFKAAWDRAVPLIRSAFAATAPTKRLRIAFCYLPDASGDPKSFFPTPTNVDVIDADVYAQQYQTTTPTRAQLLATVRARLAYLSIFGAQYAKPVALSEWGLMAVKAQGVTDSQGRGDAPEIIDVVFDWAEHNQAQYMIYFNFTDGGVNQTLATIPNSLLRYRLRAALL